MVAPGVTGRQMQVFEYKVIPAPRRGEKARGARTVPERFAVALTHAMNDMAREGWEYIRADTLPCDERVGLTGTATHFQNMLVFRRALPQAASARPEPVRAHATPVSDLLPDDQDPEATQIAPLALRAPEPTGSTGPTIPPARSPFTQAPPNGRL